MGANVLIAGIHRFTPSQMPPFVCRRMTPCHVGPATLRVAGYGYFRSHTARPFSYETTCYKFHAGIQRDSVKIMQLTDFIFKKSLHHNHRKLLLRGGATVKSASTFRGPSSGPFGPQPRQSLRELAAFQQRLWTESRSTISPGKVGMVVRCICTNAATFTASIC
jgi:hypothetical protein